MNLLEVELAIEQMIAAIETVPNEPAVNQVNDLGILKRPDVVVSKCAFLQIHPRHFLPILTC